MLVVNFHKYALDRYKLALEKYNNPNLFIDRNAYDDQGNRIKDHYALRHKGYIDYAEEYLMRDFWTIYNNIVLRWAISTEIDNERLFLIYDDSDVDSKVTFVDESHFMSLIEKKEGIHEFPCLFTSKDNAVRYLKAKHIEQKCKIVSVDVGKITLTYEEWLLKRGLSYEQYLTDLTREQRCAVSEEYGMYLDNVGIKPASLKFGK